MRRLLHIMLAMLMAASAMAAPARRGQWRIITTADGTQVRAELVGDELCHYWRTADGRTFAMDEAGRFVPADAHALTEAVAEQRMALSAQRAARFERNFGNANAATRGLGNVSGLTGEKKGIVLLVAFADKGFTPEHTPEFYQQVLNEGGLEDRGYTSSLKQYFSDMSNGQFTIDFDVFGIITLPQPYAYYGKDGSIEGSDIRFSDMIRKAIQMANEQYDINGKLYDWDGDGCVDQVFVLFAGYGQATKDDDPDLIWPKQTSMSNITLGNARASVVACSNEIDWNYGEGDCDMGVGVFLHEYSHCLGFPDTYDVDYACNTTGMDFWDPMDLGLYNGNSFVPAPYTALEKMQAGWIQPTEMQDNTAYLNLRPVTAADGGDVLVMHNPDNSNEMYLFEVIKNEGWCSGLYKAKGLLITHVDFSLRAWQSNLVNCTSNKSITSHPRCTYVPADGQHLNDNSKAADIRGDLYPYYGSSAPAADTFQGVWYTGNMCSIALENITLNSDGTVSLFTGNAATAISEPARREDRQHAAYNLQGQRIDGLRADGHEHRGIIIRDGKKWVK